MLITVLMVLAIAPVASMAEGIGAAAHEKAMLKLLDNTWAELEAVEAQLLETRAGMSETVLAMYTAVLNNPNVDKGSIGDLRDEGFTFKVNGMCCSYNYRVRNTERPSAMTGELIATITETVGKIVNTKNGPTSMNVLLVGPYYGIQSTFTDQYRDEANSIAETTGGEMIELANSEATGPAIAAAYPDCGIVIYDSHGTAEGTSSYLCLTTNAGITSEDYSNGWAVSSGSAAYIDGRYIQHHVNGELPNTLVWMAICEGMKLSGRGTTGYALIEAGAGCVYGYSQSVSFSGDYEYEAHFWNNMKNNNMTVAEAFNAMTAALGNWDPAYSSSSGSAWPIVMSPDDPFPANPDSHQTVNCDWQLFGGNMEPVEIEDGYLDPNSIEVYNGFTETVSFTRIPDNANNYDLVWGSEDENIATVTGNKRRATVTGTGVGTTRIYCDIMVGEEAIARKYCSVETLYFPTLNDAANAPGNYLDFTCTTNSYPWSVTIIDGEPVVKSGNAGVNSSTSTLQLVIDMQAGETLSFRWKVSSESNYDKLGFYVNNTQQGNLISGNTSWATITYTAPTTRTYTFEWRYTKDVSVHTGDDCGYVDAVAYSGSVPPLMGDVDNNGSVDSADALLVLRYAMGIATLTPNQLIVADVNGDGVVNSSDALAILRGVLVSK